MFERRSAFSLGAFSWRKMWIIAAPSRRPAHRMAVEGLAGIEREGEAKMTVSMSSATPGGRYHGMAFVLRRRRADGPGAVRCEECRVHLHMFSFFLARCLSRLAT
jgi:hypothetical protein